MNHSQKAEELFKQGYNCAQSVFCAFSEELGLDFETAAKLSSSFGGGMGKLREVCGAVSAMFMVAGLKKGYTSPNDMEGKTAHYKLIQELAKSFKENNGSIVCRQLLGDVAKGGFKPEERSDKYYMRRPCAELVRDAAAIAERILLDSETPASYL